MKKNENISINNNTIQQKSESADGFKCMVSSIRQEIEILSSKNKYILTIPKGYTDSDILFLTKVIFPIDLALTALFINNRNQINN